jgi:hypothetical protein
MFEIKIVQNFKKKSNLKMFRLKKFKKIDSNFEIVHI